MKLNEAEDADGTIYFNLSILLHVAKHEYCRVEFINKCIRVIVHFVL